MTLEGIVRMARERGASDIHLEGRMPAAFRVRGELKTVGDPVPSIALTAMAREVIGEGEWHLFLERCSWDLSRTVGGARCRINVLRTSRGVGFARAQPVGRTGASAEARTVHAPDGRTVTARPPPRERGSRNPTPPAPDNGVLELDEEDDPEAILRELERRGK